jgi:hypothetical protein
MVLGARRLVKGEKESHFLAGELDRIKPVAGQAVGGQGHRASHKRDQQE